MLIQLTRQKSGKKFYYSYLFSQFPDGISGFQTQQPSTNENDILCRFFTTGLYERRGVLPTLSPSMDIQVASNFERYLYYRFGRDPARVQQSGRDDEADQLQQQLDALQITCKPAVVIGIARQGHSYPRLPGL